MKLKASLFISLGALLLTLQSHSMDLQVQMIGDQFVQQLPLDWKKEQGLWEYFDITKCFTTPNAICFGNNPSSPYGFPAFTDPVTQMPSMNFQMNQKEAVILIFRTPSQMRYFSFAQYLAARPNSSELVFASLSDSLNHLKIGTTGSNVVGVNVFDSYGAVVWTADVNTFTTAKNLLISSGLPEYAINFLPLPVNLPFTQLKMGYGSDKEQFNMLMRTALPAVPAAFESYKEEKPFYVLKVGPSDLNNLNPSPVIGYQPEISGYKENPNLQVALNNLVSNIKLNYSSEYSTDQQAVKFGFKSNFISKLLFSTQEVDYTNRTGWDCIENNTSCFGDNHDALYSKDTSLVRVKNLQDMVIIAGVNHQKTGKAVYINHSVYDLKKLAGIVTVSDPQLTTESALYHAGIKDLRDPRALIYRQLYAYVISYDCQGKRFCLQIPAPTADDPVGLPPGTPFFVVGRSYLEPRTKVRPSETEIIHHQVFIGSKK